jgi:hypothetical protein
MRIINKGRNMYSNRTRTQLLNCYHIFEEFNDHVERSSEVGG